ncbi:MAG TPA: sigma-70 family RNA polymerase sigma factor [Bryobacteraceae bacterium]|nr:sigma-70 family RNA polymerase sigma factor [Bryobacteraceae bacterium]
MSPPTTSFGAVEKVKSGDYDAFSALFGKYRRRLAVFLRYTAGPELLATFEIDDLLQETFLRAFRDVARFTYESPGSFWNWLASIAGHVVLDAARFQGRQKRHAAEILRFRSETNPLGPDPVDCKTPSLLLSEKEAVAALFERLDALPEDYRQVILLAKVEGLSTAEIAARLGKSRENAALLLHRALKRFRAQSDQP